MPWGQVVHLAYFARLFLKNVDESMADNTALFLRVGHAFQLVQEPVGGIYHHQVHAENLAEEPGHLGNLALAQNAVIHKNGGQVVADGLVQQKRHHRGVHPRRKARR